MGLLRYVVGVGMAVAGLLHFAYATFYVQVFPPWVPANWLLPLVWASGLAEVAVGLLLTYTSTNRWGRWGLLGLMVAFLLLHLYHLHEPPPALGLPGWAYGLRAAVQVVLVWLCLKWIGVR